MMTPEEAQKRLEAILADHDQKVRNSSGKYYAGDPVEINSRAAKQALTALCRDVCGEVIGEPIKESFDLVHSHTDLINLQNKQHERAARYFPVDGGGEKETCGICGDGGHTAIACPNTSKEAS